MQLILLCCTSRRDNRFAQRGYSTLASWDNRVGEWGTAVGSSAQSVSVCAPASQSQQRKTTTLETLKPCSIRYRFDMVSSSSSSSPSAVINPVELPSAARRFKPICRRFRQAAGKRGNLLKYYGDTPTEQMLMKIDDDAAKVERMQKKIEISLQKEIFQLLFSCN